MKDRYGKELICWAQNGCLDYPDKCNTCWYNLNNEIPKEHLYKDK